MEKRKKAKVLFPFFFFLSLWVASVCGMDIDSDVDNEIMSKGYAEVIVFVDSPLSKETETLLGKQEYLSGQDMQILKKVLKEKKKIIKKQQQNVLRQLKVTETEMSPTALENEDIDVVLEERYSYINAFSGTVTREGYEKLLRDEHVTGIYKNEEVTLLLDTATRFVGAPFAQTIILNGSTVNGSGIGVCVIDTGVDTTHEGLQGVVVDQYCYCSQGSGCCPNGKKEDASAGDDNGHGTAVIGTIASQDGLYPGVAPGAHIMAVKAFSSKGSATTADVFSGIAKCLEKASEHNIKVFSFSFGGTTYASACDEDPLAAVANELVNLGFFVSAASGNSGDSTKISTPACGTNVTAVGAVYDNSSTVPDTIPSFSNGNSVLDILAPGVNVCTTAINGKGSSLCSSKKSGVSEETAGRNFGQYSGTSFSAPMVAGAAALIAQYKEEEAKTVVGPFFISSVLTSYGTSVLDPRNGKYFPRLNIENTLLHIDADPPVLTLLGKEDKETIVRKGTTINVTMNVSDTVNNVTSCFIEYNGTNVSMIKEGVGRTVKCSGQITPNVSGLYNIYATDGNGNSGQATRSFIVYSAPPVIETVMPEKKEMTLWIPENQTFMISATDPDNETVHYLWSVGATAQGTAAAYTFVSEVHGVGTYGVSVHVSDGLETAEEKWNVTVQEHHVPVAQNVTIVPEQTYRNESLQCLYEYEDKDSDAEHGTQIFWYKNNELQNTSNVTPNLLGVGDFWNCSVIPADSFQQGEAVFSRAREIQNALPTMTVEGRAIMYETEPVTIKIVAEDSDGDEITISVNESGFVQNGTQYEKETTLDSAGVHTVLVNASDGYNRTTVEFPYTVVDAEDTDGDLIPDFKDNDDDNDGYMDEEDKVLGLPQTTYGNVTIEINGSQNITGNFTELLFVSLLIEESNVSFFYNFSTALVLNHVLFDIVNNGEGNLFIHNLSVENKTIMIPHKNQTTAAVCVYDVAAPERNAINAGCGGANQYLISCDGTETSRYTCTDVGEHYVITGLQHSGILEMCIDGDGDGYGAGCAAGTDCNDTNAAVSPVATEIADNGIDDNCDGTSSTTPAAVSPVAEETSTAAAGGGGGGGPGPTTSDEAVEESGTEQAAESDGTTGETIVLDTAAVQEASEESPDAVEEAEVAAEEKAEKNALFSLTGAAVADIMNGKVSYKTTILMSFVMFVFVGLIFGVSRMLGKKKVKPIKPTTMIREQFKDIYEGIKELFR